MSPPTVAHDAGLGCPERSVPLPRLLPHVSAAPLLLNTPGVTVRVDGAPVGTALAEGTHLVEATADGAQAARLQLRVEAFTPVLLDAREHEGVVTLLVLGARCASCPPSDTDLDLRFRTNVFGAPRDVASALSTGDWLRAAQTMPAIPEADRAAPELRRLLAVLYVFAGRPSLAEAELAKLPADDALRAQQTARERLVSQVSRRQLDTATERWNALSDRFQRVTEAFVDDAPEVVTDLTWALDGFSQRLLLAHGTRDAIGGEVAIQGATLAIDKALEQLRALHPDDCAWQRRVVATF